MDQQAEPIRVAAIGMDARMAHAFQMLFQGSGEKGCVLVEEESAETAIIDLDAYHGKEICDDYRTRYPNHPVILISLQPTDVRNGFFLRKPLNSAELLSTLATVRQSLRQRSGPGQKSSATAPLPGMQKALEKTKPKTGPTLNRPPQIRPEQEKDGTPATHRAAMYLEDQNSKALIGTAPDIDSEDPAQWAKAEYDPSVFLQSTLSRAFKSAHETGRQLRIETSRGAICIASNAALLQAKESQLRTLSTVPVITSSLSVSPAEADCTPAPDSDSYSIDREALLWKSALWASRGRVPLGTSLYAPVSLKHWPNMTRLLLFPHALRIAALWASQPYSLLATAKILNVRQRYVFSFYSAAHTLGLVSIGQSAAEHPKEATLPRDNQQRGLFGRILDRLRKQ